MFGRRKRKDTTTFRIEGRTVNDGEMFLTPSSFRCYYAFMSRTGQNVGVMSFDVDGRKMNLAFYPRMIPIIAQQMMDVTDAIIHNEHEDVVSEDAGSS